MTTLPPRDGNGQNFPAPEHAESVLNPLHLAEDRLVRCRKDFAEARRDVRSLRREERRARRRELLAKAGPRVVTISSLTLAVIGSVAFAIAVVLLVMGEFGKAKDLLTFAGVAWGGAAALHTRRK
ncbi:hypothetical protein [Streptomyces europaeiscabiei]|uniref:hypothetical protein n=1 Tax=Streptomyces europaeiscabiei TaxID=146819 RepID=UPI000E676957|nr:hypothetical protein [Streptomyces europaeiscabiei]